MDISDQQSPSYTFPKGEKLHGAVEQFIAILGLSPNKVETSTKILNQEIDCHQTVAPNNKE
jgi:hypothetical protein